MFVKADIQKESEVKNLIGKTVDAYGRLDVAVNNAGIEYNSDDFTTDSTARHLEVINTNLVGTMYCLRSEVEQMKKQKGLLWKNYCFRMLRSKKCSKDL